MLRPYIDKQRELLGDDAHAILIWDEYRAHLTDEVKGKLEEIPHLTTKVVPPGCTDLCQPCDMNVNTRLKRSLRRSYAKFYGRRLQKWLQNPDHKVEDFIPPTQASVVKNPHIRWTRKALDELTLDIVTGSWKRAGFVSAIEGTSDAIDADAEMHENEADAAPQQEPPEEDDDVIEVSTSDTLNNEARVILMIGGESFPLNPDDHDSEDEDGEDDDDDDTDDDDDNQAGDSDQQAAAPSGRKCGLCRQPGHDRRTCPEAEGVYHCNTYFRMKPPVQQNQAAPRWWTVMMTRRNAMTPRMTSSRLAPRHPHSPRPCPPSPPPPPFPSRVERRHVAKRRPSTQ